MKLDYLNFIFDSNFIPPRTARKLPKDYCPKCFVQMNRCSKHKYKCRKCGKVIEL